LSAKMSADYWVCKALYIASRRQVSFVVSRFNQTPN
jgi:hypothetical protein